MKKRLDVLLVEQGLAASRERAQAMILAGKVLVNDQPAAKPGQSYEETAPIRLRSEDIPYVSRGGLKLEAALREFRIEVRERVALDVGASTGGFTDVLLQNGIRKVHAVDVGHNQMDWKIRSDARVVVHEKVNARYLTPEQLGEKADLIVVDVSFISLDKILPALVTLMNPAADLVTLIKPQFEVGKEKVGKGGIVTDEQDRIEVIERLKLVGESLGLERKGLIDSPITGSYGNKEFLAHWRIRAG